MIVSHSKDEREILFPLFQNNKYDVVIMKSVLNGHSGIAYSDSKLNPTVCRLDSGAYTILGGNPSSANAMDLIRYAPIDVVTPENNAWEQLLFNDLKERISFQTFCTFSSNSLNKEHLLQLSKTIDSNFQILRIHKDLANQLLLDLNNNYFFEHFTSIDDFLSRGIGFCIKYNNKIVSVVTSMAAAENMINLEIETHPEFRNKNLGTAVSANLLLYCLENNIDAQWLAANEISENLAVKLGYIKSDYYKTYIIK